MRDKYSNDTLILSNCKYDFHQLNALILNVFIIICYDLNYFFQRNIR